MLACGADRHPQRRSLQRRGRRAWSTGPSSTCSGFRSSTATRAPRLRRPGSVVLSRTEARRIFGDGQSGRPDPVADLRRRAGRLSRHRRVRGSAAQLAHAAVACSSASIRPPIFRGIAEFLTELGLAGRLGLCPAAPGHRPGDDPCRRCRPGSGATSRTRMPAASRFNPGDQQDCRLVNVRDVHLGGAQDGAMTPGQRPAHDRHLLDHRPAHPRHGLRQFHQSRHRPGQPARARGRAAQGAGRSRRQLVVQFLAVRPSSSPSR